MPDVAKRIGLTGCAVPVGTGSVIDLTCRLSSKVENPTELANKLRNSATLATLESVHRKCQPAWLLSQWCPEAEEIRKSDLPIVKCSVQPKTGNHSRDPNVLKCNKGQSDNGDEDEMDDRCPGANLEVADTSDDREPIAPCFLSKQVREVPSRVVRFWQAEEDLCVGADVMASDCMMTLDVHSCLSLDKGCLLKLVAW